MEETESFSLAIFTENVSRKFNHCSKYITSGDAACLYIRVMSEIGVSCFKKEYPMVLFDTVLRMVKGETELISQEETWHTLVLCADMILDSKEPLAKFSFPGTNSHNHYQ